MIHQTLRVGLLGCNCSIFGDETTGQAIVIDPGADIEKIEEILSAHNLHVKTIVITHAHIDHIGGAQTLKSRTGAPIHMHAADEFLNENLEMQASWLGVETPDYAEVDVAAKEGDTILLGSTEFHLLETPGHTPGSLCVWIPSEKKLAAGDTLFRESIGRTDLPGGDSRQILQSIAGKLLRLPDETLVYPGHGISTTIGHEKRFNPFLMQ